MPKNMPWFRFYSEFMDDPKISMMSDCDQLIWVKCLCLSSESKNRGFIELDDQEICWKLRISLESWKHAVDKFRAKGMIEHVTCNKKIVSGYKICNWKARQFESDNSTPRVQKCRQAKKVEKQLKRFNVVSCNVTETPSETDTNTESESDTNTNTEEKINKESMAIAKPIAFKNTGLEIFKEIYNQEKPELWAKCDKLTAPRTKKLKALTKEFGDRAIEIWQNALIYCRGDKWYNSKNLSIDNLLTNDKIAGLAERSKAPQLNNLQGKAEEFNRLMNLFEERDAKSTNIHG